MRDLLWEIGANVRIRDPLYGFIVLTEHERELIDLLIFQRLRRISQLALTKYVYPSAEHSRFTHSLGVMHCASLFFKHLFEGDSDHEARRLLGWSQTDVLNNLKLLRYTALLHDIGHMPFSHAAEKDWLSYTDSFGATQHLKHEAVSQYIIENHEGISRVLRDDEIDPKRVAFLLGEGRPTRPADYLLRRIISGDLDADRADYLMRDSYCCGVKYGMYDFERYITAFSVYKMKSGGIGLSIKDTSIPIIESFLIARHHYYLQIPYHKTRKGYDLLLQRYMRDCSDQDEFRRVFLISTDNGADVFKKINLEKFEDLDDGTVFESIKRDARNGNKWAKGLLRQEHLRPLLISDDFITPDLTRISKDILSELDSAGFIEEEDYFKIAPPIKPPKLLGSDEKSDGRCKEGEGGVERKKAIDDANLVTVRTRDERDRNLASCSPVLKGLRRPQQLFYLFAAPNDERLSEATDIVQKHLPRS